MPRQPNLFLWLAKAHCIADHAVDGRIQFGSGVARKPPTIATPRHLNHTLALIAAKVNPAKFHHPASATLGSGTEKHSKQLERPSSIRNNGSALRGPRAGFSTAQAVSKRAATNASPRSIFSKAKEGVTNLALRLDKEAKWHSPHSMSAHRWYQSQ